MAQYNRVCLVLILLFLLRRYAYCRVVQLTNISYSIATF